MNVTLDKINATTGKLSVNVVENDYKDKVTDQLTSPSGAEAQQPRPPSPWT